MHWWDIAEARGGRGDRREGEFFNVLVQKIIGGTTAVVALFIGRKGFIANVGDTRAVLCRDGVPVCHSSPSLAFLFPLLTPCSSSSPPFFQCSLMIIYAAASFFGS